MRILVTGGAGFVGSHYVRTLLAGGYPGYEEAQVTVLDKLTYAGSLAGLAAVAADSRMTFVTGDICDGRLLRAVLPGHDAVINFAAETHVDRSITSAAPFVATNVTGVQVLLDTCRDTGVGRIVHVSTDEVYGSIVAGSWTEAAPVDPSSPYAAAKAGGDLLALACARTHGLSVTITRCCNNYGPFQYPEKLIPLFTTNLLDGKPIPLYGDGDNVRSWIHVDDHCRGIQLVLEKGVPGRVYHVSGDTELTNKEVTAAILEACGVGWDMVVPVADRQGHDRRYSLDDTALRSMGYAPRIRFADGLRAAIAWYAANRAWWEALDRPVPPDRPIVPAGSRGLTTWLVTGGAGMLGRDLSVVLAAGAEQVTSLSRSDLDITDAAAVHSALERHHPDVVVNCAAWTAVDDAEAQEDLAFAINGQAVANLAGACASRAAIMIQISTDYVFDGAASVPYSEDHPPRPSTAYGRTKLFGERAVRATLPDTGFVVRTAWLYGAHGPSFVRTMINRARAGGAARVVSDQRGQPTWTTDVARQVRALVANGVPAGIYHATSSGDTTWFELARDIYRKCGTNPGLVTPVTSAEYPRPALRPAYSVLGHSAWAAAGIRPIGSWHDALHRAFQVMLIASNGSPA